MGYYAFGDVKPEKKQLTTMFELLEFRGKDASGFAYVEDDHLVIHKGPVKSTELVKHSEWAKDIVKLPRIMIFHTRAKTKGEPSNNMNNHPLFDKNGNCIVHNGIINNDDIVFAETKVKRDAQVDSEAILAMLNQKKKKGDPIKRLFKKLRGSFAFAAISVQKPDELLLVRNSNPIKLCYDSNKDIVYFCSETDIMRKALEIKQQRIRGFFLNENHYHFLEMKDDHAMWIGPDGIKKYQEYDGYDYSDRYDFYGMNYTSRWSNKNQIPIKYGGKEEDKSKTTVVNNDITSDNKVYASYGDEELWLDILCPYCQETITVLPGTDNWCDCCGMYIGYHYQSPNYHLQE